MLGEDEEEEEEETPDHLEEKVVSRSVGQVKYQISLFYIKYCSQYRWKKRIHASKFGAIIKAHGKYQEDFISSKLSF